MTTYDLLMKAYQITVGILPIIKKVLSDTNCFQNSYRLDFFCFISENIRKKVPNGILWYRKIDLDNWIIFSVHSTKRQFRGSRHHGDARIKSFSKWYYSWNFPNNLEYSAFSSSMIRIEQPCCKKSWWTILFDLRLITRMWPLLNHTLYV